MESVCLRDSDLSAHLPPPPPNPHGNQTLQRLSVLNLGWERRSCPSPSSSRPLLCIGAKVLVSGAFPPYSSSLKSLFHPKEGVGSGLGAGPGLEGQRITTCTLAPPWDACCTHLSHGLLVKARGKEFVSDCELSLCLGLPVILN